MPLRSATSRDSVYFDALAEAGGNILRAAKLLEQMFDTWPEDTSVAREILKAVRGNHNHFPVWSPDGRWIYYTHSIQSVFEFDIWRIPAAGGRQRP